MSHIVEVRTEVRDVTAIRRACERLQFEPPAHGTTKLFSGEVTGWMVNLPGWRYPAVFDTGTGQARYDNYEGRWGEQAQLDRFQQAYAVEKAWLEARKKGHTVTEQSLTDGSIKLTVQVGGVA